MRINKYIASATSLSRRAADSVIAAGRVHIDGKPAVPGAEVTANTIVTLDNRAITPSVNTTTIMLNKPPGYVVSRVGQGSKTIYDTLPKKYLQLNPVGRLDKDSSGLLLLTNDGDLANRLTHPRYDKAKVYEVTLNKPLEPLHQQLISDRGIMLEDGLSQFLVTRINSPVRSTGGERSEPGEEQGWHKRSNVPPEEGQAPPEKILQLTDTYQITMHEGRNRQIRRTFAALGYTVIRLHRTQFGPYTLGDLEPGSTETA